MDLTNPIYHNVDAAREHLESIMRPDGPVCPHCGEREKVTKLQGKSKRPGLHSCASCRGNFTVTVGTVLKRSKVPLNKWVTAFQLMASSKKGMSAHQLHRMLGVTYKTAWFMAHRIRESMRPADDAGQYVAMGREFVGHGSVNHSIKENVRHGGFMHTNTIEGNFSILKRGIDGVYQHVC